MQNQELPSTDLFGIPPRRRVALIVVPGVPMGKESVQARVIRNNATGKHFAQVYIPAETRAYMQNVKVCARKAVMDMEPLQGPCEVFLKIYLPIPQSWPEKKKVQARSGVMRPVTKPDCDNCEKAAYDALSEVIYRDDCQIVDCHASKYYSDYPRLEIEVMA